MMGIQELDQGNMFYTNIYIAERTRWDHSLRPHRREDEDVEAKHRTAL